MAKLESEVLRAILDAWPVAVLATVGVERVNAVPIVFVRVGELLYSPVDGKPKQTTALQRRRNVARDSTCSMLLQHYDDDWRQLWWVQVHASATEVAIPADAQQALRAKYRGYEDIDIGSVALCMKITAHNAWAFQGIDWLRRQFER